MRFFAFVNFGSLNLHNALRSENLKLNSMIVFFTKIFKSIAFAAMKVVVPYHSGSGHTKKLAGFIAQGTESVAGVQAELVDVALLNKIPWESLEAAHAIIFGAPTYMGSASAPFKAFMDATGDFWLEQKWTNKIAAGFTVSTGPSGDKLNTLIQMSVFAAQHGMIWVGQNVVGSLYTRDNLSLNEPASWLGLMATASRDKSQLIHEHDRQTARLFGERVAKAAKKWNQE